MRLAVVSCFNGAMAPRMTMPVSRALVLLLARYKEALHFCHGFLVGAFQYYLASVSGPKAKALVCPPDPPPTRNEAIAAFIAWAQAHPQYMSEAPVETEFRFLTERWPCKR